MGDPKGFMKYAREGPKRRPVELRVLDWKEFYEPISDEKLQTQGARCMDCGVPFCHTGKLISGMASGCPIHNLIPEWNDLVYRGLWEQASGTLFSGDAVYDGPLLDRVSLDVPAKQVVVKLQVDQDRLGLSGGRAC